jgi:hypothetical protein
MRWRAMKTVGKILGFSVSFSIFFLVIFVLFEKYGKQYENRTGCHRNRSGYGWAYIPSVFVLVGKFNNFSDFFGPTH